MRHGSAEASNDAIGAIALRPALRPPHRSLALRPNGVTAPTPVTQTRFGSVIAS
jgi:hypothetical protein